MEAAAVNASGMVASYAGPRRYGAASMVKAGALLPLLQALLGTMNAKAAAAAAKASGGGAGAGSLSSGEGENEWMMKCVMRLLVVSSPPAATAEQTAALITPLTEVILGELVKVLARVCANPSNPTFNHYAFESLAVLVRSGCFKKDGSATVLATGAGGGGGSSSVYAQSNIDPAAVDYFEAKIFPPLQHVLQHGIAELMPYVFQILAMLLELRPAGSALSQSYTVLFPPLLTAGLWQDRANIPGLSR